MDRLKFEAVPVLLLLASLLLYSFEPVVAQCSGSVTLTADGSPTAFEKCASLPVLGSSLAWTFNATTRNFKFAFQSTLPKGGWAGWGFNPTGTGMIGGSALIAFSASNGSNVLPYKLNGSPSPPGAIDMEIIGDPSVLIDEAAESVVFGATLRLKEGQTVLNQLWNTGDSVTNFTPAAHDLGGLHYESFNTLDVTQGTITAAEAPHKKLKDNHGIINALAWGTLFPIGVMAARYMRPFKIFNPLWFYIHVGCQLSAYVLGVVGWGMGLRLGSYSVADNKKHANIGIALFTLATLQITALVVRPNPEHEKRKYWNVYHHSVGFAIIILGVINIFEGIDLLNPEKGWKTAYVAILCTLAVIALILEITTWGAWWYYKKGRIPARKLAAEEGNVNGTRPPVYGADNANQQWVREPQM